MNKQTVTRWVATSVVAMAAMVGVTVGTAAAASASMPIEWLDNVKQMAGLVERASAPRVQVREGEVELQMGGMLPSTGALTSPLPSPDPVVTKTPEPSETPEVETAEAAETPEASETPEVETPESKQTPEPPSVHSDDDKPNASSGSVSPSGSSVSVDSKDSSHDKVDSGSHDKGDSGSRGGDDAQSRD